MYFSAFNNTVRVYEDVLPPRLLRQFQGSIKETHKNFGSKGLSIWNRVPLTFWYPFARKPKTLIEEILCKLNELSRIPESNGIEWWFNVRASTEPTPYHYDKDEFYFQKTARFKMPIKSGVLYMTDFGYPTVIQKKQNRKLSTPETVYIPPKINRLTIFKGDLLHGAAKIESPAFQVQTRKDKFRIALAMSWWNKMPMPPNCVALKPEYADTYYHILQEAEKSAFPQI